MKVVLLGCLLFMANSFGETLSLESKNGRDWRDAIRVQLDIAKDYSIVWLNSQRWEVPTEGNLMMTILKLQAKEINAKSFRFQDSRIEGFDLRANQ